MTRSQLLSALERIADDWPLLMALKIHQDTPMRVEIRSVDLSQSAETNRIRLARSKKILPVRLEKFSPSGKYLMIRMMSRQGYPGDSERSNVRII